MCSYLSLFLTRLPTNKNKLGICAWLQHNIIWWTVIILRTDINPLFFQFPTRNRSQAHFAFVFGRVFLSSPLGWLSWWSGVQRDGLNRKHQHHHSLNHRRPDRAGLAFRSGEQTNRISLLPHGKEDRKKLEITELPSGAFFSHSWRDLNFRQLSSATILICFNSLTRRKVSQFLRI